MFYKLKPQYKYYLISFLTGLWFSGAFISKFFTDHVGLNQFQINILQSVFMLAMTLTMVPTGIFADRYGRKKSLMIGLSIGAITIIWYGLAPIFWLMIIGEIFFGLHTSFASGADKALLQANLKRGQVKHMSSYLTTSFVWHMIGLLVASPIGNFLAQYGLEWTVVFSAFPLFIAVWVVSTFKESTNGHHQEESLLSQVKEGVSYLIRHPQLARKTWIAIIISNTAYFVIWLYPVLVQNLSTDNFWLSTSFNLMIGTELCIAMAFRKANPVWKQHLLNLGKYAVVAGFLAVAIQTNPFTVALFIVLAGSFGLSYWSFFQAEIQQHIPEARQATVNSGVEMIRQGILIIANPIIGWLANDTPYPAILILTFIGALALMIKPSRS